MPPKKGGKGKGKGKGKGGPVIIDGVDTTSMTREQLEVFALRIKEELEREREERNFFQLERDKIRTFWEINRTELEEARAKLRNKDRAIEEAAEKNEEEMKFFKQKVKHLQYEHQNDLAECKAEALVSIKLAQDDHAAQEKELLRDKRELKRQLRETENAHQEEVKAMKMQVSEEISKAREKFETMAKETENKYEKLFHNLQQELHIKHTMEMTEVEERKNTQISELTRSHEKAFNEMKNYYNDITLNNLALISSLKDQMEVLRNTNERMVKYCADLSAENKKLMEPLRQAQDEVKELRRQMQNYEKDKLSLQNTKVKLQETKQALEDLRWANEALELRFEKLQAERNELNQRFVNAVLEVQQKTGMKNVLLQKRMQRLTDTNEHLEAVIGEMEKSTQLQPATNQKLEEILRKKNAIIKDLQYELARVAKAHDDIIQTYEEKLVCFGIPKEELGFMQLKVLPMGQAAQSKGPAGLVAQNR